jgi:hypothetical protein
MSEDQNRAPRHPRLDRRSVVPWADDGAAIDPAALAPDVTGALALPLRRAAVQATGIAQARAAGAGVVLAGQAWLNQLPPAQRPRDFAALPHAFPRALDLDSERLSPDALADYAERHLDAQLAAGATLATTPAHLLADAGGSGREQELALARATVVAWRERQGWRPPPQRADEPPRELHAALAVRPPAAADAESLLAAYAELEVDGYWLTLVADAPAPAPTSRDAWASGASGPWTGGATADGATAGSAAAHSAAPGGARPSGAFDAAPGGAFGAARDGAFGAAPGGAAGGDEAWAAAVAGVAGLALRLQEATGRPVTVAGAGEVHVALLAGGVAATCVSPTGPGLAFPPRPFDGDGVTGIATPVYHPAIVGHVPPGAASDEARTALFATEPCRCGFHVAFEAPRGRRETLGHNRWCLASEARDVTRLVPALDEIRLGGRLSRAASVRRRLGLAPVPPAWAAAIETARARRARIAAALA